MLPKNTWKTRTSTPENNLFCLRGTNLKLWPLWKRVQKPWKLLFFSVYRAASDTSILDEESLTLNDPSHPAPAGGRSTRGVYLTVPPSMQRSIQKYRENHNAFLRLVSHEALGSFNPWAIADRFESNDCFINKTAQSPLKCGLNYTSKLYLFVIFEGPPLD